MRLLRTAIINNRLDLAAHALVLAAIKTLSPDLITDGELNGEPDDQKEIQFHNQKPDLIREQKVLCAVK
jgi:hypothetical protein